MSTKGAKQGFLRIKKIRIMIKTASYNEMENIKVSTAESRIKAASSWSIGKYHGR